MRKEAKIDFIEVIKHHDLSYAQRIYPSVAFCNNMMVNGYDKQFTDTFIDTLYSEWNGKDEIFPHSVISRYKERIPVDCIMQDATNEDIVGFWLSYLMGLKCSSIITEDVYPLLFYMSSSYEGRGFYFSYNPNEEILNGLIERVDCSPEYILKSSRIVNEEGINAFMEYNMSFPKNDVIKNICSDSFHSDFIFPPEECTLLLCYLLKARKYDKWVDAILNMKLPSLQLEFCKLIKEPYVFVELYKILSQRNNVDTDILRYALINDWMHSFVSDKCNYLQSLQDKNYDKAVIKVFQEGKKKYESSLEDCISDGISVFGEHEGMGNLSRWIFSKTKRRESNDSNKAYNYIVGIIQKLIAEKTDANELNTTEGNLHYLAFVSTKHIENRSAPEITKNLLENILSFIKSDEFSWQPNLGENDVSDMKAFAKLFSYSIDIASLKKIMRDFKVTYEGLNVTKVCDLNKKAIKECYVLCILLFISEIDDIDKNERVQLFDEITSNLINQCHCCGMDSLVRNYYQIPLNLAELIADQILNERKEEFEKTIATHIYAKDVVLKTLFCANNPIAQEAINNIRSYKRDCWENVKNMLSYKGMTKNIKTMEELFLNIDKKTRVSH